MPFLIVALTLFASLLAANAEVGAETSDVPELVRVERVLTADQIDSSTVDAGALAVVVYGQGEQHPVSGAWAKLDTARGYIKAVDSQRLIVGLVPDGWSKWIALERIQTLSLTQAEPEAARSDSLSEQMEVMVDVQAAKRENPDLRIAKKVVAGTASGGIFTAIAVRVQAATWENPDPSMPTSGLEGVGFLLFGAAIGCSVGFPLGVTSVDPYDSLSITLFSGVIPGAIGIN